MVRGRFHMNDTGSIVSMKPVETRLIFGNTNLGWKWHSLPINIHSEMRVNVKGKLFLLITIDIVYWRILRVDNLWGLRLVISVDDIGNNKANDHYYRCNHANDGNASSLLLALALCFAA